jgi:ATP-binding cassette subfamily B protein
MSTKERALTRRELITAIIGVARLTYNAAPVVVVIKLIGTVINSVLPVITTYFAARTTTALADAYGGNTQAASQAIGLVVMTALLGIVAIAWGSLSQYIDQMAKYKINSAISDQMYERFLSLDFWRYDDKNTADLYDRAKQFSNYLGFIFDRLSVLLTQVIMIFTAVIALSIVSWWLGLIIVIAVIPTLIIQLKLSRAQTKLWNENVETRRALSMIEWNMFEPRQMGELRLYGVVRHLLDFRIKLRDKDEKQRVLSERSYIPKRLGADIVEALGEIIALIFITLQIVHHLQPIGQFIYVQQIVSRAFASMRGLINEMSNMSRDFANLYDYQEFMKLPKGRGGTQFLEQQPDTITLKNVAFTYPHAQRSSLHNVSLQITKGDHIAIVGENGAGKSTLVKILTGLYQPSRGTVILNDTDLEEYDITSWHRYLGVLQQNYLSYGFATDKDNIRYGDVSSVFSQERFDSALRRAQAKEFLEKLPKGVDNYVIDWMEHVDGTKGVELSGGQWQRLALARNFYRDSPIIILDEPTSAIDALAESRIFNDLLGDKTKTIITISHRLTTVEKADRIYMLQDGTIVEQGTHAQLVKKKGEYYRMFESQL